MENSELEDTALKLFKKLHIEKYSPNIEDCHWLPTKGSKRVIVNFSERKDANSTRKVKKNVKSMDLSSTGVRSPVHVNDS